MGRDSNFVCKTCKKSYYLGHMSYSLWVDQCDTLTEFYEKCAETTKEMVNRNWVDSGGKCEPPKALDLYGNINVERCLKEHEGHEIDTFSYDWHREKDGDLYWEDPITGELSMSIEDYSSYEQIDLYLDDE